MSSEEHQLAAELAATQDELANTPASVVVANHVVGLFQLAAIHLNRRPPNLADGQLAIDAMAALVEGLAGRLGAVGARVRGDAARLVVVVGGWSSSAVARRAGGGRGWGWGLRAGGGVAGGEGRGERAGGGVGGAGAGRGKERTTGSNQSGMT